MDLPGTSTQSGAHCADDSDDEVPLANQNVDPIQNLVDGDSDDLSSESSDVSYSSDDDLDIGTAPPVWALTTSGLRPITFVRLSGLLVPCPGQGKPIDYFRLLLDDIFLENVIKFSNAYAFEVFKKPDLTPNSRINKWKDITMDELLHFIGLLLHTGTIRLNRLQDYWKTDKLFSLQVFRHVMSRDRFLNILRCLYFHNPNHQEETSMDKIKFVVGHFNNKMNDIYYPQKELSLDEAMILWRGRLHFRQYIKGKRHKYGVKLYSLTEHSGLILKFHVYGGSSDLEVGGKGHTEKVVLYLLQEKLNNGHSIFMDNFYNSYLLASKLLARNTYCTGTLRLDRKNVPNDIQSAKLKRGETVARYGNSVMIGKWRDKRVVTYISTEFENEMVDFITKHKTTLKKPLPIIQYNAYMSGVDRADQLLSYYPCERKTMRWYKKIFIHILQMMLLNAHNLHNKYQRKINFYKFRLEVIRSLLPPLDVAVESPGQKRARLGMHQIQKIEGRTAANRIQRKTVESVVRPHAIRKHLGSVQLVQISLACASALASKSIMNKKLNLCK
ncbi:piggyBac transposable element-derived protein 4-like [Homalodisca vitripennis]|uniref:piggyBac transposable element-derived protein 4-like n=1 Tax=Homalodisca vitripennis TaxID=197043 RepID=UPI001EEA060F|nr:piggyBac transposable element-derived protein 4-like [Homalodisca vitripennis]